MQITQRCLRVFFVFNGILAPQKNVKLNRKYICKYIFSKLPLYTLYYIPLHAI